MGPATPVSGAVEPHAWAEIAARANDPALHPQLGHAHRERGGRLRREFRVHRTAHQEGLSPRRGGDLSAGRRRRVLAECGERGVLPDRVADGAVQEDRPDRRSLFAHARAQARRDRRRPRDAEDPREGRPERRDHGLPAVRGAARPDAAREGVRVRGRGGFRHLGRRGAGVRHAGHRVRQGRCARNRARPAIEPAPDRSLLRRTDAAGDRRGRRRFRARAAALHAGRVPRERGAVFRRHVPAALPRLRGAGAARLDRAARHGRASAGRARPGDARARPERRARRRRAVAARDHEAHARERRRAAVRRRSVPRGARRDRRARRRGRAGCARGRAQAGRRVVRRGEAARAAGARRRAARAPR